MNKSLSDTTNAAVATQTAYKKNDSAKAGYLFTEKKNNVEMEATDNDGNLVLFQSISKLTADQIKGVLHREGYRAYAI